jgi:glycosyltransferase involved in cell wall biosynthesis
MLFPPDMGGGASRAFSICSSLRRLGHDVSVISLWPHYPAGLHKKIILTMRKEVKEGITVIRVPTLGLPHQGYMNRLLVYTWFPLVTAIYGMMFERFDILLDVGPHPFTDLPTLLLSKIRHSKLIRDISDLWPDAFVDGSGFLSALLGGIGRAVNKVFWNSKVDALITHNEYTKKYVLSAYNIRPPIIVLHNALEEQTCPTEMRSVPKLKLRRIIGSSIDGAFVVLYHGVLGRYQCMQQLVLCSKILAAAAPRKIMLIFIGDGEQRVCLTRAIRDENLRNIVVLEPRPRWEVLSLLQEADIGLVPICTPNDLLLRIACPYKACEFLSRGVPILAPKGSFIGHEAKLAMAGFEVNFSDPDAIAAAIVHCAELYDTQVFEDMRRSAAKLSASQFSGDHVDRALNVVLRSIHVD